MKEIEYVYEEIKKNNYTILPDTIAEGIVYKIPLKGNLDNDGYEVAYLYLNENTGIKKHTHINDIERYKLLKGNLKVFNQKMDINICKINESHCIDKVDEETIIQTIKISKNSINEDINNKLFDNIIGQL